jgi:hypothetical protein
MRQREWPRVRVSVRVVEGRVPVHNARFITEPRGTRKPNPMRKCEIRNAE